MENQVVTFSDLKAIRMLDDIDLIMLISEIHDQGWIPARLTLSLMPKAEEILKDKQKEYQVASGEEMLRMRDMRIRRFEHEN